jgi:hypothetical protein
MIAPKDAVAIVATATAVFAVVKVICETVGWFTGPKEDQIFRRQLDHLYDQLDTTPVRVLADRFFRQFYSRSREAWFDGAGGCGKLVRV